MKELFLDEIEELNEPLKGSFSGREVPKTLDASILIKTKTQSLSLPRKVEITNSYFFTFLVCVVAFIFGYRLFLMQVITKEKYLVGSYDNVVREIPIQPERGVIYDRNKNILAQNAPSFSLILNLKMCKSVGCGRVVSDLSRVINGMDSQRINDEISANKESILLLAGVSKELALNIEANSSKFPGVDVVVAPRRTYVYPQEFFHTLGYVGVADDPSLPFEGKSGLEVYYENQLKGIPGRRMVSIASNSNTVKVLAEEDALPGKNITTYLDKDLQIKAYNLLKEKVLKGEATAGAVVAQDPKTGGILALVSYPGADSNKMSYGLTQKEFNEILAEGFFPFFNRAISAAYPPGSVFKPVTASAILEEKIADVTTTIFDPGFIQVADYVFKNWNTSGHGNVNILRALQVSNDTYFYIMSGGYNGIRGLGIKALAEWAKRFGFGALTGVDLNGEVGGFMPDGTQRDWHLGDTYITGIGQGDVLATPLQINNMLSYFANGGHIFKPKIAKSIDGVGLLRSEILAQNLLSEKNYDIVREGLVLAVSPGGTGYPFYDFPQKHGGIKVAGKTGTAEYIDSAGENKTHAWFCVFGPYDDPNIVLTVFLEGGASGADDAGPIARDLFDEWFKKGF